jgi:hypothetical protein
MLVLLLAGAAPAAAQGPLEQLRQAIANLPPGFLDLSNIDLVTGDDGVTTATAVTALGETRTDVLVSFSRATGARGYILALRPDEWSLAKALPQLQNPALDGLTLSNVALIISGDSVTRSSSDMQGGELEFFKDVFKSDEFTLTLRAGLNLIAAIPVERLPAGHPLLGVMDALGIERGVVRVQGTLGKSLALLAQPGAGGADVIRDLYLRAELPPMRPPGSPEWFRSGQLALEITGDPSVRLVGEMKVRIQEDEPLFFLSAALARTGVSLSGGLREGTGWPSPFGIEWMTLNKVVLKLGLTAIGSVQLGFAGDLVLGTKELAVAIAIAISPAGVPTNFIFTGESATGFGLSDLLAVQARMAAAKAATGGGGPLAGATIPLDALPAVEFRDIGLKFAPKPEPDLGVAQGFAIKGRLLLPTGADGSLKDVAAVDVSVGDDGIRAKGSLAAFQVGPLTWQDAALDLTATPQEQRLRIAGDVQLFGARQKVDLDMSRTALRFNTVSELFGGRFRAQIDATAAFNLQAPKFRVHALAQSDLAEALDPIVRGGAVAFSRASKVVIDQSDAAAAAIRTALGRAEATAAELRTALESQRAAAASNVQSAEAAIAPLAAQTRTTAGERDRAYRLWDNTPVREVALRVSRRADWLREVAQYNVAAARYAAQAVVVSAAKRVLAALPPVDQNVALLAAGAATAAIRTQLETAERALADMRQGYESLAAAIAQGGTLLSIERAEATADLEDMKSGQALQWRLAGVFANAPFDITESLDFSDMAAAGGAILSRLVGR